MGELVSVIMPVHNAGAYLEEAIRSVMAQTYSNWELLVVNDASTDNSVEIADKLALEDSRIKVFDNPTPTGYPATPRNIAVNLAKGRYIAFLDSDDVWLPNKLEHQLPFFERQAQPFLHNRDNRMSLTHQFQNLKPRALLSEGDLLEYAYIQLLRDRLLLQSS